MRKNWDKNGTLLVLTFENPYAIMKISKRFEMKNQNRADEKWELFGSLLVVTSAHSYATIKSSERSE